MIATRALWSTFLGGVLTLPSMCNVYQSDVNKICSAEQLTSGTLKANRHELFDWMGRTVASSEGVLLVKDLATRDTRSIGVTLRDEARKVGLPACPLADQCDALAKEQDYVTDITNLCTGHASRPDGSMARLDVYQADNTERMREIATWVSVNARSPDTAPLVAKLASITDPRPRAAALRAEAAKVGLTNCLLATVLESPPPPPPAPVSVINPTFTVIKVDGPKNAAPVAQSLVAPDVASAITACYTAALIGTPTLAGRIDLKLTYDVAGKVSKASEESSTLKGPINDCIRAAASNATLGQPPETGKKPLKATVTLALAPTSTGAASATVDLKGRHH